jgi:hypothetical protein
LPEQSLQLFELMQENGMYMKKPKLKAKSKKLEQFELKFKKFSFAGRDAEIMMTLYKRMLAIVYPLKFVTPGSEAQRQYERAVAAWDQWKSVWAVLCTDLEYGDFSVDVVRTVRKAHAEKFKIAAWEFRKRWVASVGATKGLYIHIMCAHLPDEIEKLGDLRPYQTQGLEHCHKQRKKIASDGTNRKKGERCGTTMAHILVVHHVSRSLSESQYAAEHTKRTQNKLQRLRAKVERTQNKLV